ncbi:MAG: ATP-grasp domain-containing protein, partial [Candidatus Geothermarchaeales archaeon]
AALIVAPESGGVLADLVGFVEDLDEARSLNSPSEAIRAVSDKMATYETLRERGLRVPRTKRLDGGSSVEEVNQAVRDMVFPLVFKLGEGEGCRGLSVVEGGSQIPKAVEKLGRVASASSLLVQELVEGVPASVNLISDGERALPLSLNLQELVLSGPDSDSGYLGGVVPLDHPSKDEALGAAEKCVESFTGLKGYMGVDMVLTREGPVVMEINPRLTTSYIGLREVVDINVAYAVVDAGLEGKLPGGLRHIGHAYFSKIAVQKPSLETLKNIYGMEGVAVPPFPIPSEERAYAIIVTHASTVEEAEGRFRAAEARLESTLSKGG